MKQGGWILLLLALCLVPSTALAATTGPYVSAQHVSSETTGAPIVGVHKNVFGNVYYAQTPGWKGLKCAECHRGDLAPMHASNCDTCHAGANPRASFVKWNGTCQQGACHPNSMVTTTVSLTVTGARSVKMTMPAFVHTKIGTTSSHDKLTPAPNLGLSCSRACHYPGAQLTEYCTKQCHGTGAAVQHTPVETKPTQIVGAHANAPYGPDYLAAGGFQGIKCGQCHSGDLSTIHADRCSACHDGAAAPRKSFTVWNKTCQQGACHPSTKITYNGKQVTAFAHKNLTSATHTAANGTACNSCHMANLRYENTCLLCHANNADPKQSHTPAEKTGTALLGIHGTAPYGQHITDPAWPGPTCADCHKGDLKVIHSKTTSCMTCHGGTNPPRNSITGAWNGTCQQGACHPTTQITYYGKPVTVFKHKNATATSHTARGTACATCHYAGMTSRTLCLNCHG